MVLSPRHLAAEARPSSKPLPLSVVVLTLTILTTLYVVDLEHTPVYFGGDEAHFAVHGYALATTGRDLNGTTLPLFVNLWDPQGDMALQEKFPAWYQPLLFYFIAFALKLLPLSEVSVRLPTAIIGGLLSPLLTYLVTMRLLKDRRLALVAMLVLGLSPPLLLMSRQALDYVCPIPFVLGWLWFLVTFLERSGLWRAFAGGLVLGVGFYSYIASWAFMPCCLVMTWVTYFRSRSDAVRASVVATVGFLLPLSLLIPWAWLHPEMFRETAGRYLVRDEGLSLMQGAGKLMAFGTLQQVIATYASYFDPMFLFVRGGVSMTTSTTRSGVFLLPAVVFIGLGLFEVIKRARRDVIALVLLGGLLLAPIPATLVNERRMIQRELFMLPFAALIAAYGAAALLHQSQAIGRWAVAALIVAMPLQFAYFYRDYFTHYANRSAFYYDSVVFTEVADVLVSADPATILLGRDLDDAGPKWRFYATKLGRPDLLSRTRYVSENSADVDAAPGGSLLVVYPDTATLDRLAKSGQWSIVRAIEDIDHRPASVILRRTGGP